jgi:hypothetical protein
MTGTVEIALANGVWVGGTCHRDVELRPLTGADQLALVDGAASFLPAQWTTEVLTRCLTRVGSANPITREIIRSLTAGDREALLLHLRRLMAGDRMPYVVTCPAAGCAHALELELSVADLLVPPPTCASAVAAAAGDPVTRHTVACAEVGVDWVVHFRLPTGADQETAGVLARTDPAGAAELLWRRCVESIHPDDTPAPPGLIERVSARMAELDAQAELTLNITCPACDGAFSAVFDTGSYLRQELLATARNLDREVHRLAYHYHWSPAEILALTPQRRQRHLALLREELSRGTAA